MDVNNIKVFENTSFVQECFELDKKIFLDNYSLQMINDDSLKELFFLKKDEELIGFIYLHGDDFEKEIYKIPVPAELGEAPEYKPRSYNNKRGDNSKRRNFGGKRNNNNGRKNNNRPSSPVRS